MPTPVRRQYHLSLKTSAGHLHGGRRNLFQLSHGLRHVTKATHGRSRRACMSDVVWAGRPCIVPPPRQEPSPSILWNEKSTGQGSRRLFGSVCCALSDRSDGARGSARNSRGPVRTPDVPRVDARSGLADEHSGPLSRLSAAQGSGSARARDRGTDPSRVCRDRGTGVAGSRCGAGYNGRGVVADGLGARSKLPNVSQRSLRNVSSLTPECLRPRYS